MNRYKPLLDIPLNRRAPTLPGLPAKVAMTTETENGTIQTPE
ncbi:MAG: hypothetical protein V4448_00075 [Pseudomonadota bacterium]